MPHTCKVNVLHVLGRIVILDLATCSQACRHLRPLCVSRMQVEGWHGLPVQSEVSTLKTCPSWTVDTWSTGRVREVCWRGHLQERSAHRAWWSTHAGLTGGMSGCHLLWRGGLCSQGFFLGSTLVHTCGVIGAMACTASESTW